MTLNLLAATMMFEGRLGCSTRPRQLAVLLFSVIFVGTILLSRQYYGALFRLGPSASPQNLNALPTEPVVFALIMYSESSAKEGAILMKVLLHLNRSSICIKLLDIVCYHVHDATPPVPYHL